MVDGHGQVFQWGQKSDPNKNHSEYISYICVCVWYAKRETVTLPCHLIIWWDRTKRIVYQQAGWRLTDATCCVIRLGEWHSQMLWWREEWRWEHWDCLECSHSLTVSPRNYDVWNGECSKAIFCSSRCPMCSLDGQKCNLTLLLHNLISESSAYAHTHLYIFRQYIYIHYIYDRQPDRYISVR